MEEQRIEVTAVVVTCGATPYVRRTLEGIAAQTLPPRRVVIVDVWAQGRDLGTGEDLQSLAVEVGLRNSRVVHAPRAVNFGDAIRQGIELNAEAQAKADKMHQTRTGEVPVVFSDTSAGWYWLLHDDSAPHPEALASMVAKGETGPSIAVVGPKQADWDDPDRLLEAGIYTTRTARRLNPIDDEEIDQGQYDALDDVLAVGMAGALVRQDVWRALGGPDPVLGPFGDGLEFSRRVRLAGYRVVVAPGATVYHKRASYEGLRSYGHAPQPDAEPNPARSFGSRRRAQLYNWIVAAPGWQIPFIALWLLIWTPMRALARFILKDGVTARSELSAGFAILSRPDLWRAGRRRIAAQKKVPASQISRLEVTAGDIRRAKREQSRVEHEARALREAPSELELAERAALVSRRRRAAGFVGGISTLLALIALWPVIGLHQITGGGMLPSDAHLSQMWSIITSNWIPAGDGVLGPADPIGIWALLPLITGLSLGTIATVALILAVPLSALGAWLALGTVTRSLPIRVWGSLAWALMPTLLLSVIQGRIGPSITHAVLPFFVHALMRALGLARRDVILSGMIGARRVGHEDEEIEVPVAEEIIATLEPPMTAGASAALLASVVVAATPVMVIPLLIVWLILLGTSARARTWFLPVPALLLLVPTFIEMYEQGSFHLLFATPGVPVAYEPTDVIGTLTGLPFASSFPWWIAVGLTIPMLSAGVLATVAFLRTERRAWVVRAGWLAGIVGFVLALAAPYVAVAVDVSGQIVRSFPGAGLSLMALGFLIAAAAGSDGLTVVLSQEAFGWRQISTVALAGTAAVALAAATVAWPFAARSPESDLMLISPPTTMSTPAISREVARDAGSRTLALTASDSGIVAQLWTADGSHLHLVSAAHESRVITDPLAFDVTADPDEASQSLAELVASLSQAGAQDPGALLSEHAIGVVVVPPADVTNQNAHDDLVVALDATPGLLHITENEAGTIWRVTTDGRPGSAVTVARAVIYADDGSVVSTLSSGTIGASAEGDNLAGTLVLAERADNDWVATADGQRMVAVEHGWQQAFIVPDGTTTVSVSHQAPAGMPWLVTTAIVFLLTAAFALPIRTGKAES